MKVIKEGKMHKGIIWEDTCEVCESRLRMIEGRGDPAILWEGEFGAYARKIKYECPICKTINCAYYGTEIGNGGYVNNTECEARRIRCNTKRMTEVKLTIEDLEEIRSWSKQED